MKKQGDRNWRLPLTTLCFSLYSTKPAHQNSSHAKEHDYRTSYRREPLISNSIWQGTGQIPQQKPRIHYSYTLQPRAVGTTSAATWRFHRHFKMNETLALTRTSALLFQSSIRKGCSVPVLSAMIIPREPKSCHDPVLRSHSHRGSTKDRTLPSMSFGCSGIFAGRVRFHARDPASLPNLRFSAASVSRRPASVNRRSPGN